MGLSDNKLNSTSSQKADFSSFFVKQSKTPTEKPKLYKAGELFSQKPIGTDYLEITQGGFGDCFFLSGINALCFSEEGRKHLSDSIIPNYAKDPRHPEKQIIESFNITMFGKPVVVSVKEVMTILKDDKGEPTASATDNLELQCGNISINLVSLLEIAFSKTRPDRFLWDQNKTQSEKLEGGKGNEAFLALTPWKTNTLPISQVESVEKPLWAYSVNPLNSLFNFIGKKIEGIKETIIVDSSKNFVINPTTLDFLNNFNNQKSPATVASKGISSVSGDFIDPEKKIHTAHAYALKEVNPDKKEIVLEDPHDTKKPITVTYNDFAKYFLRIDYAEIPA